MNMSRWRREALERLPEFQKLIASKDVDGPMMLWIKLNTTFAKLCLAETPPIPLLLRIWQYCEWCLNHNNDHVRTAAAYGFCEHLIDTPTRAALLPQIIKRSDFLAVWRHLEYHNSPEEVDSLYRALWP